MSLQIRNIETNETIILSRDVRTIHPDWVHAQCETDSDADLQEMLSQLHEDEYAGAGDDSCGISKV